MTVEMHPNLTPEYSYIWASKTVRSRVADLLCRNCRFADMTPTELLQEKATNAQLEADVARAQLARNLALQELQNNTGTLDWGQIQQPPAVES